MHWRRPAAAGGLATKPRDGRAATVACDERLTGGTLELRADGAFDLALATELDCRREGGGITIGERRYFGVFRLEGRHLIFTGPERPALPTTFEGDLRGTGIVLQLPRTRRSRCGSWASGSRRGGAGRGGRTG